LCMVGVLRAVGFVLPPLLDGVGQPARTLRYMSWAAITLPLCFVGFAYLLGGSFGESPALAEDGTQRMLQIGNAMFPVVENHGYLSVAIAWACGYPIAFAILISLAMST